ncbi:MAG TPA: YggT family protein [Ardenticatenaceae bacterium]|nr:YggT family protein [Ardenticatenaceae bacterium]
MQFVIDLVSLFFQALNLAIVARILLSWLPALGVHLDRYNPVVRLLYDITDPILEPFRRVIPPLGMVDISPMVAVMVLNYLIAPLTLGLLQSFA